MSLTIREAFEKAGLTVPKDKALRLYLWDDKSLRIGYPDKRVHEDDAWVMDVIVFVGWYPNTFSNDHLLIKGICMDNMPAIDAYDVLPDEVKAVVK